MYDLIDSTADYLVVSKHAGVDFHKTSRGEGIVERLRADLGRAEIYPVHRLDTITSGLLILARTRPCLVELSRQFRERAVSKFYVAVADGHPKKKQGTIVGDMKKGRNGEWILARSLTRPAVTQFISAGLGNGLRLYLLRLLTGRTHQIRVALKSVGAPVLGDAAYAGKRYDSFAPDRGYLHAYALRFTLNGVQHDYVDAPRTGRFFTEEPCTAALAGFGPPWTVPWPAVSPVILRRISHAARVNQAGVRPTRAPAEARPLRESPPSPATARTAADHTA